MEFSSENLFEFCLVLSRAIYDLCLPPFEMYFEDLRRNTALFYTIYVDCVAFESIN